MILPKFDLPQTILEAKGVQENLRSRLRIVNDFGVLTTIAGVDVGYDKASNLAHASIVLLSYPELQVLRMEQAFVPVHFPYVPGFLSFREIPSILAAIGKLPYMPSLFMVDGQGIAHPRRVGIAAHLGMFLDVPSIGVAKSHLVGEFNRPGASKGETCKLIDKGEWIGMVLCNKDNTNPLFISPGHRIDILTSVKITMECTTKYRLPEPTRLADKFSKVKKS
jgi:deoxyribonuclease V